MDNYIFPLFDPFDILINIVLFAQKGRILSGTQCFFGKKKRKEMEFTMYLHLLRLWKFLLSFHKFEITRRFNGNIKRYTTAITILCIAWLDIFCLL